MNFEKQCDIVMEGQAGYSHFNYGLQEGKDLLYSLNVSERLYKGNGNHEEKGKEEECHAHNKLSDCE